MHVGFGMLNPLSPHRVPSVSVSVVDQLLVHLADLLRQRHRVQQRRHAGADRRARVEPRLLGRARPGGAHSHCGQRSRRQQRTRAGDHRHLDRALRCLTT